MKSFLFQMENDWVDYCSMMEPSAEEQNELCEDQARHYLSKTRHSNTEIAFLVGYEDPNSFIRALHL